MRPILCRKAFVLSRKKIQKVCVFHVLNIYNTHDHTTVLSIVLQLIFLHIECKLTIKDTISGWWHTWTPIFCLKSIARFGERWESIYLLTINSQSLEDTPVRYIVQKYTLDEYTLENWKFFGF